MPFFRKRKNVQTVKVDHSHLSGVQVSDHKESSENCSKTDRERRIDTLRGN